MSSRLHGWYCPARRILSAWMLILSAALAIPANALHVALLAPPKGEPLFGEVEIIADIVPAEEAARVEFLVDGEVVGTVTSPPFKVVVDIGQENREHLLEVRAVDLDGGVSEASYKSPAVFVDDRVEARLQQLYVTVLGSGSHAGGFRGHGQRRPTGDGDVLAWRCPIGCCGPHRCELEHARP